MTHIHTCIQLYSGLSSVPRHVGSVFVVNWGPAGCDRLVWGQRSGQQGQVTTQWPPPHYLLGVHPRLVSPLIADTRFGLLGFNASATARVISRRWNDDDEISFLVEETGVPGGNHRRVLRFTHFQQIKISWIFWSIPTPSVLSWT